MLLERDDLIEALTALLGAARDQQGAIALVAGEAGVGKTSLVEGFLATVDDSTLVMRGACDPFLTPRPLAHLPQRGRGPLVALPLWGSCPKG